MFTMNQSRQENYTYLVVWGLLFAAPLLNLYIRSINDEMVTFDWMEVFIAWQKYAIYLLVFLVHNFLLAPLLVHNHKRMAYFTFLAILLGAFVLYQCNSKPKELHSPPPHEMPKRGFHSESPESAEFHERPQRPRPPRGFRQSKRPHPFLGERDIMAFVVFVLMLGANLGLKVYFRSREDRKRLAQLEKQNLEQQLEYLRYQINPHFFMNTLNNIHALVDIDPEKAQETVVELSKMMRFILYEGDRHGVPLTKEMEFIRTYVKLMQLRYTDNVRITLTLPAEVPERNIPPLILISFIENAFKHGISYQQESFVEVTINITDNHLQFLCRNSKHRLAEQVTTDDRIANGKSGGVGLANVRKRLNLLYEHQYTLSIRDDTDTYTVSLVIPL